MNEKEKLIFEQEVDKGHLVKAVLVFLDSFLKDQQLKVQSMIENGDDIKADLVTADLRVLSRDAKSLAHCVEIGKKVEKIMRNNAEKDKRRMD